MEFGVNKTSAEIIKGVFGGTYIRDIYSRSIIVQIIMLVLINMVLNVEHQ